jgi:hypothetical protein
LSWLGGFSELGDFSGLGEGFGFFMQASCARPDAVKLDQFWRLKLLNSKFLSSKLWS